jgi:ATP-binding cassette subfamily F protein uup
VTHDREFLDNIVTSTFAFAGDGRIVEYVGGWQDYLRQADANVGRDLLATSETVGGRNPAYGAGQGARARRDTLPAGRVPLDPPEGKRAPAVRRKKTFNEEREYAALPSRIEQLEEEQRRLQAEIVGADFYKSPASHIQTVLTRVDAVHEELEEALARWMELEEIGR